MLDFEMFDANLNNIINYINLRSDYDKIDNYLYYIIDTNSKLNPSDINTKLDNVRSMYEDIFNVKNVYYYPHNLSIFKNKRKNTILSLDTISPFEIPPTIYDSKGIKYKSYIKYYEAQFNNILIPVVNSIYLTSCNLLETVYAHEITHTQYIKEDPIYNELLPIFVELLASDYFNQNEQETILRLGDLLSCLKYLRYLFYSNKKIKISLLNKVNTYVESTLKALMLYNLYKNESLSSSRARIIDDINDAISYKISLNDLLSNHNITDSDAKKLSLFKSYYNDWHSNIYLL